MVVGGDRKILLKDPERVVRPIQNSGGLFFIPYGSCGKLRLYHGRERGSR